LDTKKREKETEMRKSTERKEKKRKERGKDKLQAGPVSYLKHVRGLYKLYN